jgi:hypothetical protein
VHCVHVLQASPVTSAVPQAGAALMFGMAEAVSERLAPGSFQVGGWVQHTAGIACQGFEVAVRKLHRAGSHMWFQMR